MKDLNSFPRLHLAHLPTPLSPLPGLSALTGGNIFVKRDDATGLALGGNKTRKLEFLLGQAKAEGAERVITFGAVQSNHARQTAAAAAVAGLPCDLVLVRAVADRPSSDDSQGNTLLGQLLGATIHFVADEAAAETVAIELLTATPKTFLIPPGGSTATGCLGYVAAGLEFATQCRDLGITPSRIVVAASTGGTVAGLLLGLAAAQFRVPVTAVAVYDKAGPTREKILSLVEETLQTLELSADLADQLEVTDDWLGDGYGLPTAEGLAALNHAASRDGLLLDPVYTGKAMAAVLDLAVAQATAQATAPLVFWHTGGAPALFAYASQLQSPKSGQDGDLPS
jgi:L-cysteate sulfo-lyase